MRGEEEDAGDAVEWTDGGATFYTMETIKDGQHISVLQSIPSGQLVYYPRSSEDEGAEQEDEEEDESGVVVEHWEGEFVSKKELLNDAAEDVEDMDDDAEDVEDAEDGVQEEGQAEKENLRRVDRSKTACPFCSKQLTRVDEHIRLFHRNKVYRCSKPGCGLQFLTLKNLQSHHLTCYNLAKPYLCQICRKQFHRKSNYKAHFKRHDDHKTFQCQLCDRSFVDTTGLKRHFLKHHEPEQQMFVSSCCGKMFKSKEGMTKHVKRRVCGVTGASNLSDASSMKEHGLDG